MSSRRPPRTPGGGQRFTPGQISASDDSPAQTNLGLLLQRALKEQAAQQQVAEAPAASPEDVEEKERTRKTKLCADCWHALTFKDDQGRQMARCAQDLWVKPAFTYEELNSNKVRRWYGDCPAYDDSD